MIEIKTKLLSVLNPDTGMYESIDTLKGDPGPKPVKGTDYWTDADRESIVQQVIAALGTPVFGRVDAENNIILTGGLVEGTYIVKYEDADGNVTNIGTLIQNAAYTNLFVASTAQINKRLRSNGVDILDCNGVFVTDFIDLGDAMADGGTNVLHGQGFKFCVGTYDDQFTYVHYYDASKTLLGKIENTTQIEQYDSDGNPCFTLDAQYTTARYVRITGYVSEGAMTEADAAVIVVTLNELIGE